MENNKNGINCECVNAEKSVNAEESVNAGNAAKAAKAMKQEADALDVDYKEVDD
mgnify:CR=1 FL=1